MRRRAGTAALMLSAVIAAGSVAASVAGCGGSSSATTPTAPRPSLTTTKTTTAARSPSAQLAVTGHGVLPEARSGGAAAAFDGQIVFSGGLSSAGTSTTSVFSLPADRRPGRATSVGALPGPAHDAAMSGLGTQLLLFGGGRSEGSDRIVRVLPGPAKVIGRLPQALSDLDAVTIGDVAYVIGGWNGTATNRSIYALRADASGKAALGTVARLPLGVRYPAAAPLTGRVIIAGGETTSGSPTADAWSFDPASRSITRLPSLPAPTDHAPGAVLNGRFYLLGGLRQGSFSRAILSWAPGEQRWRTSGRLPTAVSDATAVSLPHAIVVLGGRGAGGTVAAITWLAAKAS